jgi:hypothetical protein
MLPNEIWYMIIRLEWSDDYKDVVSQRLVCRQFFDVIDGCFGEEIKYIQTYFKFQVHSTGVPYYRQQIYYPDINWAPKVAYFRPINIIWEVLEEIRGDTSFPMYVEHELKFESTLRNIPSHFVSLSRDYDENTPLYKLVNLRGYNKITLCLVYVPSGNLV